MGSAVLLIYTYTAWVATHKVPLRDGWPVAALVFLAAVAIAYACLKWYDEPVRAWLKKKVLVDRFAQSSKQEQNSAVV